MLPRAYRERADDVTAQIDDEAINADTHEKLESAIEALGFYMHAVKESAPPTTPLPELIEKLTSAQVAH